jgi:NAD(P)-dependent dehydrogenase (short-subunit alcohol dehydrogenase family)
MRLRDPRGQHVVVTGSTRGIGRGLAEAFLGLGCRVTVSGRTEAAVDAAVTALLAHAPDRVHGVPCDVSDLAQVQALWGGASARFGPVDVWVNNAGISHSYLRFWDLPTDEIEAVVDTNILGVIHGTRVALIGMLAQGHGKIFNMEGLGSDGRIQPKTIIYGTSKAAVSYFTRAAVQEAEGTPVMIGTLYPGMVVTDLLMAPMGQDPDALERTRRIFNILADRVETVAPYLAVKALATESHGARIRWLTTGKVLGRFLSAPFTKRDVLSDPRRSAT